MIITDFTDRYEFLSNSHWVNIDMDGDTYPSVDHAYQAAKTFDPHKRARIRSAASAHIARQMGRAMERPLDWESVITSDTGVSRQRRVIVMWSLLADKFTYPDLTRSLLDTGDAELVNGTWDRRDFFWGSYKGRGENRLGKMLMELRAQIRG